MYTKFWNMESLQDQLDEVLLKSNWQIEEIAERERERATCNWCHRKYFKKSINEKYLTKHGLGNWWSFNIKGHKNDADTYIRLKRCTIKSQGR